MALIIGIFQFHCKSEHKQVKWNEIKQGMSKSDSIFPYLECGALFKWNLIYSNEILFLIRLIS